MNMEFNSNQIQEILGGDRIAQLVFIPYSSWDWEVVDELSDTDRGDGGFGHSGQ